MGSIPLPRILTHTRVLGLSSRATGMATRARARLWASSHGAQQLVPARPCASACHERWTRVAAVTTVVLMPPGISSFILLQCRGSCSSSIFFFFLPNAEKKKKSLFLIIKISLFCILQYISDISAVKRGSGAARGGVRRRTAHSRTWPPSPPPPRRRSRPCTRTSISAACCAAARSTGRRRSPLGTPAATPSWWFGRRRSPAAFGSNLSPVPLGKRFLEKNKKAQAF